MVTVADVLFVAIWAELDDGSAPTRFLGGIGS